VDVEWREEKRVSNIQKLILQGRRRYMEKRCQGGWQHSGEQ
jgi:hypothetical protein